MSSFGKKLRYLREKSCLKQDDIANFLNVSRGTISKYESGDREPDISTVKALANFYKVPLDFMFDLIDFPYSTDDNLDLPFTIKEPLSKAYGGQKQDIPELNDELVRLVRKIIDNNLDIQTIESIIDNIIILNKKQKYP